MRIRMCCNLGALVSGQAWVAPGPDSDLSCCLRAGVHGCCPAVSHAIPPEYVAGSYHFMMLSHSCLGIACDFGEGGCKWGATGEHLGQAGCKWAQLGPKSHVFAGGKKFGWKRMAGQRVFVAMLDALGMTPA